MTDREKINKILNLLTDKQVGKLADDGQLVSKKEQFGALIFATSVFKEAYEISRGL